MCVCVILPALDDEPHIFNLYIVIILSQHAIKFIHIHNLYPHIFNLYIILILSRHAIKFIHIHNLYRATQPDKLESNNFSTGHWSQTLIWRHFRVHIVVGHHRCLRLESSHLTNIIHYMQCTEMKRWKIWKLKVLWQQPCPLRTCEAIHENWFGKYYFFTIFFFFWG